MKFAWRWVITVAFIAAFWKLILAVLAYMFLFLCAAVMWAGQHLVHFIDGAFHE